VTTRSITAAREEIGRYRDLLWEVNGRTFIWQNRRFCFTVIGHFEIHTTGSQLIGRKVVGIHALASGATILLCSTCLLFSADTRMKEIVALNVNHSSPAKLKPFAIVILLLAICPRISAQESRPVFSSDHVLFDTQGGLGCGLKPEKYRSRAEHYEFIAFTDGLLDREYRANKNVTLETIANDAARTVKQQNPKATVLFNWAADLAKPHNKISNKSIPSDGRIILRRTGKKTVEVFDTTNPSTRNWWTDVAAKAVHDNGCDGIFIDGTSTLTPGSLYQRQLGEKTLLWRTECSRCSAKQSGKWEKVPLCC
jgi:hypothetical protein